MPPIPVYALNLEDDLEYDSPEFVEGLAAVLDEDPEKNIFAAKRLCVLAKNDGHTMLGADYIKTVEKGVEVSRTQLPTEKEWRDALEANFGITL